MIHLKVEPNTFLQFTELRFKQRQLQVFLVSNVRVADKCTYFCDINIESTSKSKKQSEMKVVKYIHEKKKST